MTRDEIFGKVKSILADAMGVDEDDVTPEATLRGDLGAESIDFLDIVFRLEQGFGIKIQQGELFPDSMAQNAEFVQDGRVTQKGIDAIQQKLPHVDLSKFAQDPQVTKIGDIFTVEALVRFVQNKLAAKGA